MDLQKKHRLLGAAASGVILFCLFLEGCATSPHSGDSSSKKQSLSGPIVAQPEPGGRASHQETRDYQEIEDLYFKNQKGVIEGKFASFSKHHPRSSLLPSVENLHGLYLLKQKKPELSVNHFRRAILLNPNHQPFNQYILYNLASAQFETGLLDEAQQSLNQINLGALDKGNRLKVYYLKATLFQKKSLPLEAARQLLTAGRLLSDFDSAENQKSFYRLLDQALQNINDIPTLETLYQEFEESPVADTLLMRLATRELAAGNIGNAEIHLRALMTRFPQSTYYAQASETLAHPQTQQSVEARSVGVLLPLKGKFGKFGMKSLQGIQLALGIFSPNDPDSKISLIVEDSGEDPDQAIKALNRLVFKHHVVAVIGPMLSKGVDQISQRAQELGVPLLSLSRRAGPQQDYIFQAGLTQQLQAFEIARYAIQKLSLHSFAVVYPNDKFGAEMSQSFWDAVESLGGKIVGVESYTPGETDFRQSVDKLAGTFYPEARQRELDLLAAEREANHIKKRTRKTEQFFNLRPIVDFDAVFIPDEPKVAGQILPTFAYRDIEHVRFLGTSSWNSPEFLSRAQNYGENSIFPEAFFPETKSPVALKFFEKYKQTFGQDPTSLEALAYDAGALLQYVLNSTSRTLSRSDLRDALKSVRDFPGVTGKLTFKDGNFFRDLRIIQANNGRFTEVQ